MTEDHTLALATPTRFLLESGEWNITPTIRNSMAEEMNPFEYNFQERAPIQHPKQVESNHFNKGATPPYVSQPETVMASTTSVSPLTPPMSVSQSPSNSIASSPISNTESQLVQPMESTSPVQPAPPQALSVRRSARAHAKPQLFNDIDEQEKKPSRSVQSGRKRRIVFEGDDAEDRRKKFLERNRVAAYKCRQKKKTWMQELEQHAEMANSQNEELRSTVAQLKEESMYLRNMLLTHGNCDCETVQAYLRKTSAQITGTTQHSPVFPSYPDFQADSRRESTISTSFTMPSLLQSSFQEQSFNSFPEQSTGLTPFLNTVINKTKAVDYFS